MFRIALLCLLSLIAQTPSVRAAEPPPLKIMGRTGQKFTAGGAPFPLIGINRYELAGGPLAAECQHWGGEAVWWKWASRLVDQTKAMGGNVIRLWAFQNYAGPTGKDFSHLDKVIAYAKKQRIRLILVLENQWQACTKGGVKDAAWFQQGYKGRYGYPLSFTDYTHAIVTRYKDEPTIAMWQVLNEGKLYESPKVLRGFLVEMARFIKARDSKHLVSSGGAIQCWQGAQGATDFESYSDDSSIDVLDFHNYDEETIAWPVCAQNALRAARALNKPLIIGETGIRARSFSSQKRGELFTSQIAAAAKNGVAGFLIWQLNLPGETNHDNFDFLPNDPTWLALRQARSKWPAK